MGVNGVNSQGIPYDGGKNSNSGGKVSNNNQKEIEIFPQRKGSNSVESPTYGDKNSNGIVDLEDFIGEKVKVFDSRTNKLEVKTLTESDMELLKNGELKLFNKSSILGRTWESVKNILFENNVVNADLKDPSKKDFKTKYNDPETGKNLTMKDIAKKLKTEGLDGLKALGVQIEVDSKHSGVYIFDGLYSVKMDDYRTSIHNLISGDVCIMNEGEGRKPDEIDF